MVRIINKEAKRVASHLLTGELAIIPCDTIYGIVGIAPESESKILELKERENSKKLIQLVTLSMIPTITEMKIDQRVLDLWPGPLTVVVLNKEHSTTAIRVPNDPFLAEILDLIQKPLFTTSVNVSGNRAEDDFEAMVDQFSFAISLFVHDKEKQKSSASTLLDITTTPYKILRQGACQVDHLI